MQIFEGVSEVALRLSVFVGVFAIMAALELARPRRKLLAPKAPRWLTNLSMVGLGMALGRGLGFIAQPLTAVGAALLVQQNGWGLMNQVAWPTWLEVVFAVVVLDFAIWFQHVASHRIPVLWRLHRVHHADVDIDVTTALRFHPVEIGFSMLYKVIWVLVLGPSVLAVVLFEVMLNGCAMFNHANIRLPMWLDQLVRIVIVTPDMHRVHHSIIEHEHSSNFGFNLSIWDRLFSTYTAQPSLGHDAMTIGLPQYQSPAPTRLGWSLWLPFGK
jgi:sterol desaturase/sphingolipid hydroxylase (fatty acid hydroxylase superfamily)